ncbi:IlvD/Edd family dehydratase [Shumkonia mesophila]|uniref:IlvD/Edd family dehydratase n=1 Tax=Shumkonia mesophila TaxID=2838854 RepID=UPI002934B46F|nr:IlvD/Edd family dehydratase [Shumkonia mesophila]
MADNKKAGMRKGLTNYGDPEFSLFIRKAFIKAKGYSDDALDRPVIGIANTGSDYNPCHGNAPELIEAIKRGVMLAGGLPMQFPTVSLHEAFSHPTSMFLRNLMSIDTEEMIRAQPMDAVVLIGGCDKTVPAQLMAAASVNIPAICVVTGPMLSGTHGAERVGACTDCRRLWGKHRVGEIDEKEITEISGQLVPSIGFCGVMGTASTMACMTEALGMMLPGGATIPAVHSDRMRHAETAGRRAVAMVREGLTPDKIITPKSIANALRALMAIGGSTNGIIHYTALAGRLGIQVDLDAFDRMGNETPVLVDIKPSGTRYMDDFHKAGGMRAVLREIRHLLNLDCLTVSGRTLGEEIEAYPEPWPQDMVRPLTNPISQTGGIAVLRGNIAPRGAIFKQSAASKQSHTGRAIVFESQEDMISRIDDPALDVTPDDILVMRNAGPVGAPAMPEAGYIPIPKKLAAQGVKDMIRMSDARMSGTAFGSIVLHICPEAAVGGPLALVRTGDRIRLDVPGRSLDVLVFDDELAARRTALPPPRKPTTGLRGYYRLFLDHVQQADEGCDFDFLTKRPYTDRTP